MKAKTFSFILILTLSVISIAFIASCDRLESPIYNAEAIPGPWSNNGYDIREIGWDEYEVYEQKTNTYWIEYLDPFSYYETCIPDGCWPERYEPYYSTTKDELCWHVYCRGRFDEVLIFQSGKYAPR